jgi:hypothetical protein
MMTANSAAVERRPAVDPVVGFAARAEARATLYAAGEFDLHGAVDVLQADAEAQGLVEAIGQDRVQTILVEAFLPVRQREWVAADAVPLEIAPRRGTPSSTIEALIFGLCESGLSSLAIERFRDRLACCDGAAIREISARLLDLKSRSKGRLSDWTKESVAKLVSAWAVRGRN